ncbi:MAG: EAL domain-containing protein, partial [Xanthomonadales bacterium]|nr:EAL domain-containing protein [Xanthomonadales bacterium]
DGRSGQIVSVEALIRWQHPELNLLLPDDFIPLAEESGLINTVGNWVIREACRQLSTWAKAGYDHLVVAANISTHQLRTTDLPGFVAGALREAGVRGNRLALEITEGVVMDDPDQVLVALGALKSLGIKLAVDDFGTGYSSLAYLKRFPLDVLKVDRVFVEDIVENQNDADLVAAIVTMAKGLGLAVVAEGVETEEQFRVLRQLGCRRFQGYLFSPPVPAEELERLLEQPAPFRAVCQPRGLDSNRA